MDGNEKINVLNSALNVCFWVGGVGGERPQLAAHPTFSKNLW